MKVLPPAPGPCVSCPYAKRTPSGIWSKEEYEKLPPFDNETGEQPWGLFLCHQKDGRICAGWAGCHNMDESLSLRLAQGLGMIDSKTAQVVLEYQSPTPLWESGEAAYRHGTREIENPSPEALKLMEKLALMQEARDEDPGTSRDAEAVSD